MLLEVTHCVFCNGLVLLQLILHPFSHNFDCDFMLLQQTRQLQPVQVEILVEISLNSVKFPANAFNHTHNVLFFDFLQLLEGKIEFIVIFVLHLLQ